MSKSTSDFMSEKERQDLRDAGRGHLIREDMADRADHLRDQAKYDHHEVTDTPNLNEQ